MEPTTRQLIQGYLRKAESKLGVAERLLAAKDFEDSISRSYYAVFHAAQALLLSEGQKAETHKGVLTLFGLLFVQTGKLPREFGKCLADLKDDRENGDYEVFSYADEKSATEAVEEAKAFLAASKDYLRNVGIDD